MSDPINDTVNEFSETWKQASLPPKPKLEDFLRKLENLRDSEFLKAFELLLGQELLLRKSAGENVSPDEYIQRFKQDPNVVQRIPNFVTIVANLFLPSTQSLRVALPNSLPEPTDGYFQQIQTIFEELNGPQLQLPPNYSFVRKIGQGGFGVTLLCKDKALDRNVVFKIPRVSPKLRRTFSIESFRQSFNFVEEARKLAKFNHPHIVQVYSVAAPLIDDTLPDVDWLAEFARQLREKREFWIEMEFVDGTTLAEYLDKHGPFNSLKTAKFGLQLCKALARMWEDKQFIHRDLKPANILIDKEENLKIIDFGLTVSFDDQRDFGGSFQYMSPEQAQAYLKRKTVTLTHKSDCWSLAVVL